MGIHGLHVFLKAVSDKKNIRDFAGKTVGVDAMCWMHKGAFACAQELLLGEDTDKFVWFFLRMCEILRTNDIKPVIVFDGCRLPAKAKEESRRQDTREKARQEALEMIEKKKSGQFIDLNLLQKQCSSAIRITPGMIARLMRALRELSIHMIVSPFEADAQLAYMCRTGWLDSVISEDGDLLAYGCPSTFFKMDAQGNGHHISLNCLQPNRIHQKVESAIDPEGDQSEAESCDEQAAGGDGEQDDNLNDKKGAAPKAKSKRLTPEEKKIRDEEKLARQKARTEKKNESKEQRDARDLDKMAKELLKMDNWTPEMFAQFCTFCGTDYKEPDISIKGFGIKTAFKYMCQYRTPERLIQVMRRDPKSNGNFPDNCGADDYMRRYNQIIAVFFHHTVFDMRKGECVSIAAAFPGSDRTLQDVDIPSLCGSFHPKEFAARIARGEIDARTHEPRVQEPFTRSEKRLLDRMLSRKRQEQNSYNSGLMMQKSSERAIEAMAANKATQGSAAASQQSTPNSASHMSMSQNPVLQSLFKASQASTQPAVFDLDRDLDDEPETEKLEMVVLKGDKKLFEQVLGDVKDSDEVELVNVNAAGQRCNTPQRPSFGGNTPGASKVNPFARKRNAPSLVDYLPKKPRISWPQGALAAAAAAKAEAEKEKAEEMSRIKQPEYHPRGGDAAKVAAAIVLAQRRGVELDVLDDSKNKNKLTAFFKIKGNNKDADENKASKLSMWNPRPWEQDVEDITDPLAVTHNSLSLKAARSSSVFRNRGNWESGGK